MPSEDVMLHPLALLTNVKYAVPIECPVTTPPCVIVATPVLLELHIPPLTGVKVVLLPTHILFDPVNTIIGLGFTVIYWVVSDLHPVAEDTNTNLARPADNPITCPELLIDAIELFTDIQLPGPFDVNCVVDPIHIESGPDMFTVGFGIASSVIEGIAVQPILFVTVT
jgi:hypothetical protein